MEFDNYITEANRQLLDTNYYIRFINDPTSSYRKELKQLIKSFPLQFEQDNYLIPENAKPGTFYMLPKIHKPNIPGRPIVSNIGCLTEHISGFVEEILKPYVQSAPSFILDTNDFLSKLKFLQTVPEKSILVTMDVRSLYTNITHEDGLRALRNRLPNNELTTCIIGLTKFILEHNYFRFNQDMFLQIKETAKGTKMAPQYANLFMADLEEKILDKFPNKPIIYLRYIDDIFLIWTHEEESLKQFYSAFNSENPSIKLTMDYSMEHIHFLDSTVIIQNGHINTSIYKKPTDTYTYLHPTSSHPPHVTKSIVFSQALRYCRLCSEPRDRNMQLEKLSSTFHALDYDAEMINKQISRARDRFQQTKDPILSSNTPKQNDRPRILTTYNKHLNRLKTIAKDLQPILENDPTLKKSFSSVPMITYRQPPSLKHIFTSSQLRINNDLIMGTQPCQQPRCKLCPHINTNDTLTGPSGYTYHITDSFSCTSTNIIYAITCTQCPKAVYIGETMQTLRKRINGHRNDYVHNRNKPVAEHFNLDNRDLDNLKVMVLKYSTSNNKQDRLIQEQKFIFMFDCVNL